jgi:hypothetical protein
MLDAAVHVLAPAAGFPSAVPESSAAATRTGAVGRTRAHRSQAHPGRLPPRGAGAQRRQAQQQRPARVRPSLCPRRCSAFESTACGCACRVVYRTVARSALAGRCRVCEAARARGAFFRRAERHSHHKPPFCGSDNRSGREAALGADDRAGGRRAAGDRTGGAFRFRRDGAMRGEFRAGRAGPRGGGNTGERSRRCVTTVRIGTGCAPGFPWPGCCRLAGTLGSDSPRPGPSRIASRTQSSPRTFLMAWPDVVHVWRTRMRWRLPGWRRRARAVSVGARAFASTFRLSQVIRLILAISS